MDALTLVLALCVTVAVVGQLLLILWGNHFREVDARQLAKRRADLLEAAADRQLVADLSRTAKLDGKNKGVGDE